MHGTGFATKTNQSALSASWRLTIFPGVCVLLLAFTLTAPSVLAVPEEGFRTANSSAYLQRLQQEIRSDEDMVNRKYFDFDAVLQDVGRDPHELYEWVKSNTAPLPYTGVLKGAWGVLMERRGNSLDRSLLLVELLERAGYQAELSNATLNDKALSIAKNLVRESLAVQRPVDTRKEQKTHSSYSQLIDKANEQTKALIQALPLKEYAPTPEFNNALESLKDHWWVLAQSGEETVVFDFFFEQQVSSLKMLGYTDSAQVAISREDLPEILHHQVTFRIIADKINAQGEETSGVALKHTIRTAKSLMQPVSLAYLPIRKRTEPDELADLSGAGLSKNLAMQDEWLPLLRLGDDIISQASIRADGSLNVNAKMPESAVGAFNANLLNEMNKSIQGMSLSRDDQLAEVRLEIDLTGGGDTVTQTRTLFDFRDHIIDAFLDREKQKAERVRTEAERVYSLWEEEQAELNKQRQACSEQSGVDLEDLWVLGKNALSDVPEMEPMLLLSELYGSDKCVELSTALAYAKPEPTGKPGYRISSKAPRAVTLSEEVRTSRAAKFMSAQHFLLLPFDIPDSYLYEELRSLTLVYLELSKEIADASVVPTQQEVLEKFPISRVSMLKLLNFSLLRQQPSDKTGYGITRTNLVSQYGTMSMKNSTAEFTIGIDIIENHILPLSDDDKRGRWISIQQGVFDTLLENYLIAGEKVNSNTASQFNFDLEKNRAADWVLAGERELRQRFPDFRNELDPSKVKMALYSPLRMAEEPFGAAFWLVDLETGHTLGYSNSGRGDVIGFIITNGIALANGAKFLNFLFFLNDYFQILACAANISSVGGCGALDCGMEFMTAGIGKAAQIAVERRSLKSLTTVGLLHKFGWLKVLLNAVGEYSEYLVAKACGGSDQGVSRYWTDSDGDGVPDFADQFPDVPRGGYREDSDRDGIDDIYDDFPNDPTNSDTSGDGAGDSSDATPDDPTETTDSDGDGVSDNVDEFPDDPTESADYDGDEVGDNADAFPDDPFETTDSDGDNVGDNTDKFPDDPTETVDSDGDYVGDNADDFPDDPTETTDSDGDGVGDFADKFPNDPTETTDTDGDDLGDNADKFPNDPTETTDSDGDGVGDYADKFPDDPTESADYDGDEVGDNADAFPDDPFETRDSDGDDVGDNADKFPDDPTETTDSDGDDVGDNADRFPDDSFETKDSDGDDVGDNADRFPDDPTETTDSDGDNVGDNADKFPDDPTETTDSDGDGLGDNADTVTSDPEVPAEVYGDP